MQPELKLVLKRALASHSTLALWVAKTRAVVLGLVALPYRLRFAFTAHVPLSVKLIGIRRIAIGRNTVIGVRSWLNVNEVGATGPALVIGEHCFIGMENFFSVGDAIFLGDYCLTARNCAFIGATHIYDDPLRPYLGTGVTRSGTIRIGANCFFGLDAKVVGSVVIGHGSVIGAGAVVREDVPPFSLVVGNPARVIKRFDFTQRAWVRWPSRDHTEGPGEFDYLQQLRSSTGAPVHHISAASGWLRDIA